jgi:hypothetical protein
MKTLHLVLSLVFLLPLSVLGETLPEKSPDFTYQIQKHPSMTKDIENVIPRLDKFFEMREMRPLTMPKVDNEKLSLNAMDKVYGGYEGNTVVMIKLGVVPSAAAVMNTAQKFEHGFLHHFKFPNGLVMAAFVVTQNWGNASEIFQGFHSSFAVSEKKKTTTSFSLIPSVYAEDCVNCEATKKSEGELSVFTRKLEEMHQGSPLERVAACTVSALKGTWDGSAGAVIGLGKGLYEVITSPIESGKKFWEGATELWSGAKKFYADFQAEARKMYDGFDSLPSHHKTKLFCEMAGMIGGGAILAYFTAGATSTKLLADLAAKMKGAIKSAMGSQKFADTKAAIRVKESKLVDMDSEVNKSLFEISSGTDIESIQKNQVLISKMTERPLVTSATRKEGLDDFAIENLFRSVEDHPVASLRAYDKYTKNSPGMGFCFGRATAAHLKALQNGVHKDSIRKIWAVGTLESGDTSWRYHVTTVVRNKSGDWIAIDPIMGRPIKLETWYKEMKGMDVAGNMRLFETTPERAGPSSTRAYNNRMFHDPVYEDYYKDLMVEFRKEAKQKLEKKVKQ